MSKFFEVEVTVIEKYLVEVEDNEDSDAAVGIVTNHTTLDWVDISAKQNNQKHQINEGHFNHVMKLGVKS